MTKKPHPVEAFEQGIIARADYFTAFVQLAPCDRHTIERKTQAEAEACARAMAAQCGKAILVYAVTKEGRSALAATIHPERGIARNENARTNPSLANGRGGSGDT